MSDVSERYTELEAGILAALRAAHAPLREVVLYERVSRNADGLTPERFLATLERLATLGHLRVWTEHDQLGRVAEPFEPRVWRVVD